ncbi:MAG TPA: diiron oxygenase [Actinocrinis sp.]|nr:diiron oxygenase [Actinocrinis sp.]
MAVADRLLRSSASRFYDPEVDVDWSAPPVEGLDYVLDHRCSLYGTGLWKGLTPEQRRELGKHEAASIAGVGLWFELILMRMLVRLAYEGDPTDPRIQYALTETAEECRHTIMFARMVTTLGAPAYGPRPHIHRLGRVLPTLTRGPAMYGSILVAEEVTDRLQREQVDSPLIQPLVRMVNRIHIMEESRHIGFARTQLLAEVGGLNRVELRFQRHLLAYVAYIICRSLINPQVYAAVGIDPREGRRAALSNPQYRETLRFSGEKIMPFLREAGLIGGSGMYWWKQSFLV